APTVTTPSGPVVINADNFTIAGTAEANALVRVYRGGTLVGSQQLSGGATAFFISVPPTPNAAHNLTVTAPKSPGHASAAPGRAHHYRRLDGAPGADGYQPGCPRQRQHHNVCHHGHGRGRLAGEGLE